MGPIRKGMRSVPLLLEAQFLGSKPTLTDGRVVATTNHSKKLCRENWYIAKKIFTKQQFERATKTFQPYKSPGVD